MNKRILDELSAFLKKNNIMIYSLGGQISLAYDVHGPDYELFSTDRNSISYYDAELMGKEHGETEDRGNSDPPVKDDIWVEFQIGCPKRIDEKRGAELYISFCSLCIDDLGNCCPCVEDECPLIYLKKFMEKGDE